jgi:phosphoribosylamine--glycine ligase
MPTLPGAAVGIVLASKGYPGTPKIGLEIDGIEVALASRALVFHGGSVGRPGGGYVTNGGRVLTVVGRGGDLAEAREAAEIAADLISWDGMQRRHDIAAAVPELAAGLAGAPR